MRLPVFLSPTRNRGARFEELDLSIDAVLTAVRKHLKMEIGFISEFFSEHRCIRYVDSENEQRIVRVGDEIPLDVGYCQRIVDGRLPEMMTDTRLVESAMDIGLTLEVPIGSHMGVPIRLPSGQLFGSLCCFGRYPNRSLTEVDLQVMRVFADVLAGQLGQAWSRRITDDEDKDSVEMAIRQNQPRVVFQSIVGLPTSEIRGFECLSRFSLKPDRAPNLWFETAQVHGLGVSLEMNAIRNGLLAFEKIPAPFYMSLNCSPSVIQSGRLTHILDGRPLSRIVIEVTEHAFIEDFTELRSVLDPLRARGLRTAMDDAGAGFSSLQHLIQLGPDVIKLDIGLARGVNHDSATRAMVAAMVAFANETGATVVAEGVENQATAEAFNSLGVHSAQGFFFSVPKPVESAVQDLG